MTRCLIWGAGSAGLGLALAGLLAAVNRALARDDLPPTLPGAMGDWTWRGWRVRHTSLGAGAPVVLVHGVHAAASSYEMRGIFEPLSQQHRVYALDLPGFGKSERPAAAYSGALYADLLADFLAEVVREPAVVLASSLSAAYAVAAASRCPNLVSRLVLISPTDVTSTGLPGRVFGGLLALPVLGEAAFNLLVSRGSIERYLRSAYADPALPDEVLVEQSWATAHMPNARLAPAAFVAGQLDLPFSPCDRPVSMPILILRGTVPGIGAQATDEDLRGLGPAVTLCTVNGVGQLPHDEAPDEVVRLVGAWLAER